jgi:hypothetical protein
MNKSKKLLKRSISPMKGWVKYAPKKGQQRSLMKKKCGEKCFLIPHTNGFPICEKNCVFSCRGLLAAKTRANQYKYKKISKEAERISLHKKCKWIKSKSIKKRRSPLKKGKSRIKKRKSQLKISRKKRKSPFKKHKLFLNR